MTPVTCHLLHVACHLSPITCQMSHVTCQLQQKPQQQTIPLLTLPNMHSRMFQKAQKRITKIKFTEVKYNLKE